MPGLSEIRCCLSSASTTTACSVSIDYCLLQRQHLSLLPQLLAVSCEANLPGWLKQSAPPPRDSAVGTEDVIVLSLLFLLPVSKEAVRALGARPIAAATSTHQTGG